MLAHVTETEQKNLTIFTKILSITMNMYFIAPVWAGGLNKMNKIYKKEEGVSPVIATILMVAITVVLAATVYIMVAGIGTGGTNKFIASLNYQTQNSDPAKTPSSGFVNLTVSMSSPSSAAYSKVTVVAIVSGTSYTVHLGTNGQGTDSGSKINVKVLDMDGGGTLSDGDTLYIYSTTMFLSGAQISLSISGYSGNAQVTVPS